MGRLERDLVLGFGLIGGGVRVLFFCRGSPSVGSAGMANVRCGLGDCTGGGAFCLGLAGAGDREGVVGRRCSNMFTRDVVGAIGVSSVA